MCDKTLFEGEKFTILYDKAKIVNVIFCVVIKMIHRRGGP
jgi:hypothetical protein